MAESLSKIVDHLKKDRYLFVMRPTVTLKAIAEVYKWGWGEGSAEEDIFPAMAGFFLKRGMSLQERWSSEEGEAFDDGKKAEVMKSFAQACPMGFVFGLPQIIEENILCFDDEEILESAVFQCFDLLCESPKADKVLILGGGSPIAHGSLQ